jgi:HK97 family phage major capsid protein
MTKLLELRQERHAISLEMNKALELGTPEAMSNWKALDEKQEALRVRPNVTTEADLPTAPHARMLALRSTEQYKKDFETYIRTGRMSAAMEETRALGAATGADGATLVPQGFEAELEIKLKAFGGMTRNCRILTTSTGNPLPWPNLDDTSNTGEWLTEGSGVGSADPTVSNVTLGANLVSSKQVKVSVQLEQDSYFDIVGLLSDAFKIRIGRTINAAYTIGDGTSTYGTITGLLTALEAVSGRNVLAVGGNNNSGNSGDTDLNTVGTDDLDALIANQDPAYREGAIYMANQATWDTLRKLKDKYGRPIWQTSLMSGQPDKINGYGFDFNQDMAKIGAGNVSVIFGDFKKYVVRNVLGFTFVRFNELYMTNYQRAYQAFARTDAKLLQSSAFSYLIHPDS